jgi:receptor protein-tyrosine kinase
MTQTPTGAETEDRPDEHLPALDDDLLLRRTREAAPKARTDYPLADPASSAVSGEVVVAFENREPIRDELRELRTQIQFRWLQKGGVGQQKVIAIVSPNRGDGKTFVASNLAVSYAQIGLRTLLIDGDMRHGRIEDLFGLGQTAGLAGLLGGRLEGGVMTSVPDLPNLTVIGNGGVSKHSADLLAHESLSALIDSAMKSFDVVIVDTPASIAGPDMKLLAARSKGVIVVTRKDHTDLRGLQRLARDLRDLEIPVIGSVLI